MKERERERVKEGKQTGMKLRRLGGREEEPGSECLLWAQSARSNPWCVNTEQRAAGQRR